MDRITAARFFDREVKSRFPNWRPGEASIRDWLDWFKPFDYNIAQQAIKQHAFESRLTYPILKEFYAIAKKLQPRKQPSEEKSKKNEPVLLYSLQSERNLKDIRRFYLPHTRNGIPPEQRVLAEAEKMRGRHEQLYGGEWRIIRSWEDIKQDLQPTTSGIGGEEIPF